MATKLHQGNIGRIKVQIEKNDCWFVVGAGVSIYTSGNAQCASWPGLLRNGVDRVKSLIPNEIDHKTWEDAYAANMSLGNSGFLNIADTIFEFLEPKNEFAKWVVDAFGSLPIVKRDLVNSLVGLGVHILTTNYDTLIEKISGIPKQTIDSPQAIVEGLSQSSPQSVTHVHGVFDRPESLVFNRGQYVRHSENQFAQVMEKALSLSKTLVFIGVGAGVRDPHFEDLLSWLKKFNPSTGSRKYILLTEKEMESFTAPEGLVPIPYGRDYEDLPDFLQQLKPFNRSTKRQRQRRQNRTVETALAQYDVGSHSAALDLIEQFQMESIPEDYAWGIKLMRAKNLMRLNQFEKAMEAARDCADFFRSRDTVQYISSEAVVNTVLRDTERWTDALSQAEEMVTNAERSGIAAARCSAFHSLARCKALLKESDAVHFARRCLGLAREPKEKGKALLAMGEACRHSGDQVKAKINYEEAVSISVGIGRMDLYIWSKLGLHDAEFLSGELDASVETLNKVERSIFGKEQSHPLEALHVSLCRAASLFAKSNFSGARSELDFAAGAYEKFHISWPKDYAAKMIANKSTPSPKYF